MRFDNGDDTGHECMQQRCVSAAKGALEFVEDLPEPSIQDHLEYDRREAARGSGPAHSHCPLTRVQRSAPLSCTTTHQPGVTTVVPPLSSMIAGPS
ncbi:MAG: hypothetical protein ACI8W7_004146 [Gammaproteobacteria bacterium]|jgi:hypothetical protein